MDKLLVLVDFYNSSLAAGRSPTDEFRTGYYCVTQFILQTHHYRLPYTINFYYHDPEYCQFLEANCSIDPNGYPSFKYRLAFPKNADPTLTAIVTNHFNRLHLIKRYDEEVIKNYSEIELTIKTVCKGKSLNDALQYLKDYLSNINNDYGLNHHYVAMLRCMIGSPIYHAYLQSIL